METNLASPLLIPTKHLNSHPYFEVAYDCNAHRGFNKDLSRWANQITINMRNQEANFQLGCQDIRSIKTSFG